MERKSILICWAMIATIFAVALFRPVQAEVGAYGFFDSVTTEYTSEARSVHYNMAGFFEGEIPISHTDSDYVITMATWGFTAGWATGDFRTLRLEASFFASAHYHLNAGFGHAIMTMFFVIRHDASGLESQPFELYRFGGYNTDWYSPEDDDSINQYIYPRSSWAYSFQLEQGHHYTVKVFFKVSANNGYVEQYGPDPYNANGAYIDFSGLYANGFLLIEYKEDNLCIGQIGGTTTPAPPIDPPPGGGGGGGGGHWLR